MTATKRSLLVLVVVLGLSSAPLRTQVADFGMGAQMALSEMRARGELESISLQLLLVGGENNDTFLGCLSCSEYTSDSVFNDLGRFGSEVSPTSIRNKVSLFGSVVSPYSVCNTTASHPPLVVDEDGHFYGELTLNTNPPLQRLPAPKTNAWLSAMCNVAAPLFRGFRGLYD